LAKVKKNKIKLLGFNNLTKSLSFNIYDICYTKTHRQRRDYIEYIDEKYNAERLIEILTDVSKIIGAHILNIAHQDYDPEGASVTMLISEGEVKIKASEKQAVPGPLPDEVRSMSLPEDDSSPDMVLIPDAVVAHLDKSHITVHTYPESHPVNGISTFRADIDVSTCGRISPLKALNYLIHSFESDIVIMDYRVRGFTRDIKGKKLYIDHQINSVQNYLIQSTKQRYSMIDVNVYQENIFHTKMILKDFGLDNYLFGVTESDLTPEEAQRIHHKLQREMAEIYYGRNVSQQLDMQ
jgi:S-adenosylmethionine decarboxylase